ncbi:hypothetical protein Goarm_011507, partial [Gossypium armourianum]|nr:hypothetical protein [Gossypium armourianum]
VRYLILIDDSASNNGPELKRGKARCEISAETPKDDPDLPIDSHLRKEGFSGSKGGLGHHVMNADKKERRQEGTPTRRAATERSAWL